jgi:hypothetical protein
MDLTEEQKTQIKKMAERINVGLQDLLALDADVLALLLDPNASHELLADEWYTDEGDPEYECPFTSAEVRLHPRTGEPFAIAWGHATKLDTMVQEREYARISEFRSEPLLIGGRAVVWGWGKVLCRNQHRPIRRGVPDAELYRSVGFMRRGWLHEEELTMPEREVRERISAEIDNGTLTFLPQRG